MVKGITSIAADFIPASLARSCLLRFRFRSLFVKKGIKRRHGYDRSYCSLKSNSFSWHALRNVSHFGVSPPWKADKQELIDEISSRFFAKTNDAHVIQSEA